MRALFIEKHGGHEVLRVKETQDPIASQGEVIIKVKAAGLNFSDIMARQGLYPDAPKPPCILGYEVAGEIIESNDKSAPVGTRVMAMTRFGGQAEKVCIKADQAIEIPTDMSFEQAASVPVNYLTAYHMLFNVAQVKQGKVILRGD